MHFGARCRQTSVYEGLPLGFSCCALLDRDPVWLRSGEHSGVYCLLVDLPGTGGTSSRQGTLWQSGEGVSVGIEDHTEKEPSTFLCLRQSHGTKAYLMPTCPSAPFYVDDSMADTTHPGTVFSLAWGVLLSRSPHCPVSFVLFLPSHVDPEPLRIPSRPSCPAV